LRVRTSARSDFAVAVFSLAFLDLFLGGFSVSAHTVEPACRDSNDRQEVFGELVLGRGVLLIENHEPHSLLSVEQPLDELEAKPAEPVVVGNAHFL